MRWLSVALVALAVLVTPAGASTGDDARAAIDESARLETRALNLFDDDPNDPEIEELIKRSIALLRGARTGSDPAEGKLGGAILADQRFLREKATNPKVARHDLWVAIFFKTDALTLMSYFGWPGGPKGTKYSEPTPITPPRCGRSLAAYPSGCFKVDTWNINTHARAKRGHCEFRGPNGLLRPDRPLFPGTLQQTSCRLTNRGRVVHAELRITVPEGPAPTGSKVVRVKAIWQ